MILLNVLLASQIIGFIWSSTFKFPPKYSARQRPVLNQEDPIIVEYQITVVQLISLDEKQQLMITKVWLDQRWHDDFINWSINETSSEATWMSFRPGEIWTPDIAIDNSISIERENFNVKVESTGDAWWSMPAIVRSACFIQTQSFPFDNQTCYLEVGSWYYPPGELFLKVIDDRKKMDFSNSLENAQWSLVSSEITVKDSYHEDYQMTFRTLVFTIHFQRKSLYYCLILIIPYILVSVVSLANFLLPSESGEKIALGVTVLLSQFVNLLNLVDLIPESSDSFPILGIYYLVSMSLVAVSVTITVIVLNVHFQSDGDRDIPPILRYIFLESKLRILFFPLSTQTMLKSESKNIKYVVDNPSHQFQQPTFAFYNDLNCSVSKIPQQNNLPYESPVSMEILEILKDICKILDRNIKTREKKERSSEHIESWRLLARAVDRLFAVIYALVFVICIFYLQKIAS